MSTAMNFGSKSFQPRPPDKGSFPLDHFGERRLSGLPGRTRAALDRPGGAARPGRRWRRGRGRSARLRRVPAAPSGRGRGRGVPASGALGPTLRQ